MNNSPLPLGVIAAINAIVNESPSANATEESGIRPGEVTIIGGMSSGKEVHEKIEEQYSSPDEVDFDYNQGPRNRKERRAQASQNRRFLKQFKKRQ